MARFLLYSLGDCTICPKCSARMTFRPDPEFFRVGICHDCGKKVYFVSGGITEREFMVSDDKEEAKKLMEETKLE